MSDMYSYGHPAHGYMPHQVVTQMAGQTAFAAPFLQPEVPFRDLIPEDVSLVIRQAPSEALIAIDGKEKARKPLDPAPIVELIVQQNADPPKYFLQSPYLFICAALVEEENENVVKTSEGKCALVGSLVSSLHRIKDSNNHDGGFFVWGDISCRVLGKYRLKFSLFDFRVRGDNRSAVYLASICSEPFEAKDFGGMKESTLLSRTFQAQGIRLRLRKEPRASSYRNSSPTTAKKHTIDEVDDDDEDEPAGGAVQHLPSLKRHRSTPQQAATEFPVQSGGLLQQTPAAYGSATATESTQSTPPQMYSHPAQSLMMAPRSPQEFVGNTPSPTYYGATLANSPMMPAYTAGPYSTGAPFGSGHMATAYSTGAFSAGYATSGMAAAISGNQYAAPLAYTPAPYPPYPAHSLAADSAITDPQLSVAIPNTSMTGIPMFTDSGGEHAWTNASHPTVLGLAPDFAPGEYSGTPGEYGSNPGEYNPPLNLDHLSGMGN